MNKLTNRLMRGVCALGVGLGNSYHAYSQELDLMNVSVRARVSDETVLGNDAPEFFTESDIAFNFRLPWSGQSSLGWSTRLMMSTGVLQGAGKEALVVSAIPELVLGRESGHYEVDLGVGAALFSRNKFGIQDFGGPFQFALTLGGSTPVYKSFRLGYRFLHYSDWGGYGPHTTGADFHMIELIHTL